MARKKERPNPTGVEITCVAKSRNHAMLTSVAFPYRDTKPFKRKDRPEACLRQQQELINNNYGTESALMETDTR